MKCYNVRAHERQGFSGFNRSGMFFPSVEGLTLTEEQMTDAIRNEPMLIITELEEIEQDLPKETETIEEKEENNYEGTTEIEKVEVETTTSITGYSPLDDIFTPITEDTQEAKASRKRQKKE